MPTMDASRYSSNPASIGLFVPNEMSGRGTPYSRHGQDGIDEARKHANSARRR
jgi:hypothetical protein